MYCLRYVLTFLNLLICHSDFNVLVTEVNCFVLAPYSPFSSRRINQQNSEEDQVITCHAPTLIVLWQWFCLDSENNHTTGWISESARQVIISQEEGNSNDIRGCYQYISVARKNELQHHEHTMEQLRIKIARLTKSVDWELEQHQSRLKELKQVEDTLFMAALPCSIIEQPANIRTNPIISASMDQITKERPSVYQKTRHSTCRIIPLCSHNNPDPSWNTIPLVGSGHFLDTFSPNTFGINPRGKTTGY